MRLHRYICALCWGIYGLTAWAQTPASGWVPLRQTPLQADAFWGQDPSGALYYSAGNTLYKKTPQNTLVYTYNSYGHLSQVDLINPLRLLLFFKAAQVVVVLDNQCNEIDHFRLGDLPGDLWVDRLGLAGQNYWWGFDLNSGRWGLIDSRNSQWRPVGPNEASERKAYYTDYNCAQWVNAQGQWWRMDLFGEARRISQLPEGAAAVVFVNAQRLLYQWHGQWWLQSDTDPKAHSILWEAKWPFTACYTNQILAIFTGTEIVEYQLK